MNALQRPVRHVLSGLVLSIGLTAAVGLSAADETPTVDVAAGKRIYQSGRIGEDEFITARIQTDVEITGENLSCIACHQRSGYGSSEGGTQIPSLMGTALFAPKEIRRRELADVVTHRPAYTRETLKRAITSGEDPTGRKLDPLMPRYRMSSGDLDNLVGYLETLAPVTAPGVDAQDIHFATIVDESAGSVEKEAMLAVLNSYFDSKRAETRLETKRATQSNWIKDWHYSAYKRWTLHVWTLKGPENTWQAQLDDYYREQPVFAVVSGISDRDWQPVHDYCEQTMLPCILPNTLTAPDAEESFYSLYFGEGTALEAGALVKYLEESVEEPGTIVQIHGSSLAEITAAERVTASLQNHVIHNFSLQGKTADELSAYVADRSPDIVIAWVSDDAVQSIATLPVTPGTTLFLSSTLIRDPQSLPASLPEQTLLLHPFQIDPPDQQSRRFRAWARTRDIELNALRVQANAFFSVVLVGEAIQHVRSNFSREYFLEKIEHGAERILVSSAYPNISLAPGQRYLQKGCYIVPASEIIGGGVHDPLWIVP
jgi:hypothetical protein